MYKVLLADDEALIINGLKNLIDWEEIGLSIESTALNGEEALEKFNENPVDIIITDITMPKLNGLELIKAVKSINDKVKFIILSGYDEFSYAKQALCLGIENYILKPINEEELQATLLNTAEKLNKAQKKPMDVKELEILRENILYRWVVNSISSYELEERSSVLNIDLSCDFYTANIIKLNKDGQSTDNLRKAYEYIKEFEKIHKGLAVFNDLEGNIVAVYGSNEDETSEEKLSYFFEDIIKGINSKFSVDAFVTLGSTEKNFKEVYKSYNAALEMQDYLLLHGYNKVISYKHYKEEDNIKDIEKNIDLVEFRRAILNKDGKEAETCIDKVYNKLCSHEDVTPEILQNVSIKMMIIIRKLASELNVSNEEYDKDLKKLILDICNIKTMEKLKSKIKKESLELIDRVNKNSGDMSPVIQQVLSYIKNNYHEEISLKTLSQKYNINPSYLGQIFHKEVGEPFSDFLNKVKNEKAKELLLTTNIKVNDIAKMVGYVDTSYFYRKFKDYFGVSPSTLRGSKNY